MPNVVIDSPSKEIAYILAQLNAVIADVASIKSGATVQVAGTPPVALTSAAPTAISASNPPAGGTGANAGGWDTNTDRDLAITSATAIITDNTTLRTRVIAGIADIAALKTTINALIADMATVLGKAPNLIPQSSTAVGGLTASAPAAITATAPSVGGAGATAGGYDTSGDRDAFIASLTNTILDTTHTWTQAVALTVDLPALRTLVAGLVTDITAINAKLTAPASLTCTAPATLTMTSPGTMTAVAPPAGGTGTQAGCYDTSAHRDGCVTSVTASIADITAIRTSAAAAIVDIATLRTAVGKLVNDATVLNDWFGSKVVARTAVSITAAK